MFGLQGRSARRVALAAAVLATAVIATAGSLGLRTDGAKKPRWHQPRLETREGVLQQDRLGNWTLDGQLSLRPSDGLRWFEESRGRDGTPAVGRTARLTGQWYRGVFVIRHAVLVSPQRVAQRLMAPPEAPPDEPDRQLPQ
jgi:hypothetical protein